MMVWDRSLMLMLPALGLMMQGDKPQARWRPALDYFVLPVADSLVPYPEVKAET